MPSAFRKYSKTFWCSTKSAPYRTSAEVSAVSRRPVGVEAAGQCRGGRSVSRRPVGWGCAFANLKNWNCTFKWAEICIRRFYLYGEHTTTIAGPCVLVTYGFYIPGKAKNATKLPLSIMLTVFSINNFYRYLTPCRATRGRLEGEAHALAPALHLRLARAPLPPASCATNPENPQRVRRYAPKWLLFSRSRLFVTRSKWFWDHPSYISHFEYRLQFLFCSALNCRTCSCWA